MHHVVCRLCGARWTTGSPVQARRCQNEACGAGWMDLPMFAAEDDADRAAEAFALARSSYRVEIHDGVTFTIEASIADVAWTVQPLLFGAAQLGRHGSVWGAYDEVWEFPSLGLALDALHDLIRATIAGDPPPSEWPAGRHRHRPGVGPDGWDRRGQAAQG